MSLVTFIDNSAASAVSVLVLPIDTTISSRRLLSIIVGAIGNFAGASVTITNCIADSGATFTAYVGTDGSAVVTNNISRGGTILLPYKGLHTKASVPCTITMTHAAVASTAVIEYEKG